MVSRLRIRGLGPNGASEQREEERERQVSLYIMENEAMCPDVGVGSTG